MAEILKVKKLPFHHPDGDVVVLNQDETVKRVESTNPVVAEDDTENAWKTDFAAAVRDGLDARGGKQMFGIFQTGGDGQLYLSEAIDPADDPSW